jgi:hypothetical protein
MRVRGRIARVGGELLARPWHLALAALVAGLVLGPLSRTGVVAVAAAALLAGAVRRRVGVSALAAAAILAGGLAATARLERLDRTALRPSDGRTVAVRAALNEPPRERAHGGWAAAATITSGRARGERIVIRAGRWVRRPRAGVGDVLALHGRLGPLAPYESYERVRGAHAALTARSRRASAAVGFPARSTAYAAAPRRASPPGCRRHRRRWRAAWCSARTTPWPATSETSSAPAA